MKKRIVFFHLLNDYSGSPHVLSLIIRGFIDKGYDIDLYTSSAKEGFLAGIDKVNYHIIKYKFSKNKIYTLFLLIIAQIRYFFIVIKYCLYKDKDTVIYINTVLPYGAALGAYFFRKKIYFHIHENNIKQNLIHKYAQYVFRKTAYKAIFVSKYLYDSIKLDENKKKLIYNSLSIDFTIKAQKHFVHFTPPFKILMICSLKIYKGVLIFVELAKALPHHKFILVVNANENEIKTFFKGINVPGNLRISPTQINVHSFYEQAHLVVNLSIPDLSVETFGLTALEALTYGIPVIVPPVGGIAEIIDDNVNGYKVDSRNKEMLICKIEEILSDKNKYFKFSENARIKSYNYSYSNMINNIEKIINEP